MSAGRKRGVEPIDWLSIISQLKSKANMTTQGIADFCECDRTTLTKMYERERAEPGYSLGSALLRLYRIKFHGSLIPEKRSQ